jgi:hypothetical protein
MVSVGMGEGAHTIRAPFIGLRGSRRGENDRVGILFLFIFFCDQWSPFKKELADDITTDWLPAFFIYSLTHSPPFRPPGHSSSSSSIIISLWLQRPLFTITTYFPFTVPAIDRFT